MRRFIISEMSMSPALRPGDRLLARRLRRPRRGQIVFFPHPRREDFWLVKRVHGLPGDTVRSEDGGTTTVPSGHMYVLSDALHLTRADSRTFGPVPLDPGYVAWLRYRKGGR